MKIRLPKRGSEPKKIKQLKPALKGDSLKMTDSPRGCKDIYE